MLVRMEFRYGAGRGFDDVIGIFIGTGVGGGLIINGKLLHGLSLNAGELGHMKIVVDGARCGCGQKGCLEAYASKTAMVNRLRKAIEGGKKSVIPDIINKDWSKFTSKAFLKAVQKKDKLVLHELEISARYTGVAVGSLLNILSPEVVVIGGGLVESLEKLYMPLIQICANSFPSA